MRKDPASIIQWIVAPSGGLAAPVRVRAIEEALEASFGKAVPEAAFRRILVFHAMAPGALQLGIRNSSAAQALSACDRTKSTKARRGPGMCCRPA